MHNEDINDAGVSSWGVAAPHRPAPSKVKPLKFDSLQKIEVEAPVVIRKEEETPRGPWLIGMGSPLPHQVGALYQPDEQTQVFPEALSIGGVDAWDEEFREK